MTIPFNSSIFDEIYRDDYKDSDNFYRILFNSGKALQARELTQIQSILQAQISRFGKNIFKDGAAVNPGGFTINTKYEFVKLSLSSSLPQSFDEIIGSEFVGQTSGVRFEVVEVVGADGIDPATFYINYTSTFLSESGESAIRVQPGEIISNDVLSFTIQSINSPANPAVGRGTTISFSSGDFFVGGYFVFATNQSKIISKYTSTPTTDIGFRIVQDIVTENDDDSLYDNQGDFPNISAPGAHRYRIRLIISTRDEIDSDENFLYVCRIEDGSIVDTLSGKEDYNVINDLLALRTKEESGNYNAKPFIIKFEEHPTDVNKLKLKISDGVSYVNGYRAAINYPTSIDVDKAQTVETRNNDVISADYGNYVLGTGGKGNRNINIIERLNLRNAANYGGSTIGTARIYSVQRDTGNLRRYYLSEISMNPGQSFRNVQSIGSGVNDFFNISLEGGRAVLKDTSNTVLLFPLPRSRPRLISDVSLVVQRRFFTTTNSSGQTTLTLTAADETFASTQDWFFANADSDATTTPTVTGSGTQSATISNAPISSTDFEVLAYVSKGDAVSRSKTLVETAITDTIDSDSFGLKFVSLNVPDIFEVTSIKQEDSDGPDISSRFIIDNGQRDTHYGIGKLVLRSGISAPTGNIFVRYKYFNHGASGSFFSVNSYIGQVSYEQIPNYVRNSGEVIPLRDVLDFRSVQNSTEDYSGGSSRVNELPRNTDLIRADVEYYQPKALKLVIDTSGKLKLIEGANSLSPVLPPTPEDSLDLYNIQLNPFTLDENDMTVTAIENKRYTMADIARLEQRISRLEEITTLSLLELETSSFEVLDSAGLNRTKSGFVVDNFRDHFLSAVFEPDYRASIDPQNGIVRPTFYNEMVDLEFDPVESSNVVLKGDNVYLSYTHVIDINQNLATTTENINPFSVITHQGVITLSPSSDNWVEQNVLPARVVDGDSPIARQLSANWNNWSWNWIGNPPQGVTVTGNRRLAIPGVRITQTISQVVGNRVLGVAFVPFMRSRLVSFRAEGLKPNTRMFPFFDSVNVSNYVRQEPFVRVSNSTQPQRNTSSIFSHPSSPTNLITNSRGEVTGSFFIPNNGTLRFRSGLKEFKLLDISVNIEANSTSLARTSFESTGVIETVQNTVITARRVIQTEREESDSEGQKDPLAQSFFVKSLQGMYVTKVEIFFATKDPIVPVQIQIRPMVNGSPSSNQIIPGSVKFLEPSQVNTSNNASVSTTFEFDEPIYLAPETEYAIVLLAESVRYNVFVAEIGQFVVGSTERRVTRQPTMGSLFKSQNGSTWEPDQTKDLTFVLHRANFVSDGVAIFNNRQLSNITLNSGSLEFDSDSSIVRVVHPNHGFVDNDFVNIRGLDSDEVYFGVKGSSILGSRQVTNVDYTGYQVSMDSDANAAALLDSPVDVTQNIMYDIFVPTIQNLVPNDTSLTFAARFTTGKSFAGTETPYQIETNFKDITVFENNILDAPRLIANTANEVANMAGRKSLKVRATMSSFNPIVSPMIDLQRSSVILINNIIDNQNALPQAGFNVPLNFVPETSATNGSFASKHIMNPINLEQDAVGLKIILGANRPSVSDFKVYVRTSSNDSVLSETPWTLVNKENNIPSDENALIFRQYEYLYNQAFTFTSFQVKIVFESTNSSKVPVLRDLRIIALGV